MHVVIIIRDDIKVIWITSYTPKNIQERGAEVLLWFFEKAEFWTTLRLQMQKNFAFYIAVVKNLLAL